MSGRSGNGHIELKGSELCLYCGLCCRGVIFNRADLKPDEIGFAANFGLRYFTAGKGKFAFRLPCPLYQNNKCSVYLNRPDACKRYRCNLLKQLMNGDIDLEEGKLTVVQVNSLVDSINKRMINIEQSRDFRQGVVKLLNLQYKNSIVYEGSNALLKDIESFYIILHRYIEKRAN